MGCPIAFFESKLDEVWSGRDIVPDWWWGRPVERQDPPACKDVSRAQEVPNAVDVVKTFIMRGGATVLVLDRVSDVLQLPQNERSRQPEKIKNFQ
jgi:hypothetical protein